MARDKLRALRQIFAIRSRWWICAVTWLGKVTIKVKKTRMNLLKYQDSSNLNLVQEGWDSDPEPDMYSSGYRYSHGESKSGCWIVGIWIATIWKPIFMKFGFQMVRYSNGQFIWYVLCTRLTMWIPDQYKRKQDGLHFYGIQIVRLFGIHMAFKYWTIWHPTTFQPFEYRTSLVFRSPL